MFSLLFNVAEADLLLYIYPDVLSLRSDRVGHWFSIILGPDLIISGIGYYVCFNQYCDAVSSWAKVRIPTRTRGSVLRRIWVRKNRSGRGSGSWYWPILDGIKVLKINSWVITKFRRKLVYYLLVCINLLNVIHLIWNLGYDPDPDYLRMIWLLIQTWLTKWTITGPGFKPLHHFIFYD